MRLLPLLMLLTLAPVTNAQTYEVSGIEYTNDPLVDKYFADMKSAVQWQGLMRSEYEQQTKPQVYQLQKSEDSVIATVEYRGREISLTFEEVAPGQYQYATEKKFMKIIYENNHPTLIQGRYKSIPKSELSREAYEALTEKFGDKLEVFVTTLTLKKIDKDSPLHKLEVKKAFKVTGVELMVNEDVMEFGEAHRDMFMGYRKSSEPMIKKTYMGRQFQVEIDRKKVRVKSINDRNSSFSFSSSLETPEENVYRVQQYKTLWDFYVDDPESFEVTKLKYISFIELKEEDKNAPEYEKLKGKYGERLPYNIIVQEVEEILAED